MAMVRLICFALLFTVAGGEATAAVVNVVAEDWRGALKRPNSNGRGGIGGDGDGGGGEYNCAKVRASGPGLAWHWPHPKPTQLSTSFDCGKEPSSQASSHVFKLIRPILTPQKSPMSLVQCLKQAVEKTAL